MRHPPAWRTARFLRRSSSGLRQAFVASLLGECCYLIVNPLDFQGHAYVVRMLREETEQQIPFRLQFLAFIPPIHGGWWHGLHPSTSSDLVPGGYKLGQLPALMNCQLLQRAERPGAKRRAPSGTQRKHRPWYPGSALGACGDSAPFCRLSTVGCGLSQVL